MAESNERMFGEAFAAEINSSGKEETVPKKDDDIDVPLKTLGPKWTVGGEDDHDCDDGTESEEDAIFSKYVFSAVKGKRIFAILIS